MTKSITELTGGELCYVTIPAIFLLSNVSPFLNVIVYVEVLTIVVPSSLMLSVIFK